MLYNYIHSKVTLNRTDIQAHRLTLVADVESTVEVVMAVEASLTVVLESCSPVCLDIMRAPCDLDRKTHTARVSTPLSHLIEHLYIYLQETFTFTLVSTFPHTFSFKGWVARPNESVWCVHVFNQTLRQLNDLKTQSAKLNR